MSRAATVRRCETASPMTGSPTIAVWFSSPWGMPSEALTRKQHRLQLVAHVHHRRVRAEHLPRLTDEIVEDLVEAAARVDDGQQIPQPFRAQAGISRLCARGGHGGRQYNRSALSG